MGWVVIGAGFSRTGTMSLKVAIERLGYGGCYHTAETTVRNLPVGIHHHNDFNLIFAQLWSRQWGRVPTSQRHSNSDSEWMEEVKWPRNEV
jgi:hypothetical protein